MPPPDLSGIALADQHCHVIDAHQALDVAGFRALLTESDDQRMALAHAHRTAFYRRLVHRLASHLGVADDEESVVAARSSRPVEEHVRDLITAGGTGALVIDTGYPPEDRALPLDTFTAAAGVPHAVVLRLEPLFERLVAEHTSIDDVIEAVHASLDDARASGIAGLKSVVAYRTGLRVQRWERAEAQQSFADARAEHDRSGSLRLGHQPLLDTLLHESFALAAEQELPVQFHVGYGDTDVDLRDASPLHLRPVLLDPLYRGMPLVLLHGSWPFTREAAYLASVHGNAYLDLSYGVPYLSSTEMLAMTRAALGVAPWSKLVCSSDGVGVPEVHWMGAVDARRCVATALGELVDAADLTPGEALEAGAAMLEGTTRALYGLHEG